MSVCDFMKNHGPYDIRFTSSLEKIFQKRGDGLFEEIEEAEGLKGECVSFQIAYRYTEKYVQLQQIKVGTKSPRVTVRAESPFPVTIRRVCPVPVTYAANATYDDDYISTEAGLYPDILRHFDGSFFLIPYQWRSLWVDVEIPKEASAGEHVVSFSFQCDDGNSFCESLRLRVIDALLPESTLIHTEWFHPDCLSNYYKVPPFSEAHWAIMEDFIAVAAKRGCNMILTPLFTLPLDTYVGGERPTLQLVKVKRDGGKWSFDFSLLERYVTMCLRCGMKYFEMSHLFTQWGARYCPKIIAQVDGKEEKVFGWHTAADSPEYSSFLSAFLPSLTAELEGLGIADRSFFHISDEPSDVNMESYRKAVELACPYLEGFPVIDALSHIEIYRRGIVKRPIPTDDTFDEFYKEGLPHRWVYYCCSQDTLVPNRFIAMPSYRNRIIGFLFYRYDMEGFLHWGYNNYYSQYSLHEVDPYKESGAEDAFPAGDPFIVYPGPDGKAEESIRLLVLSEAINDLSACRLLEKLKGREHVLSLICPGSDIDSFTFRSYPRSAAWILETRRRVDLAIEEALREDGKA